MVYLATLPAMVKTPQSPALKEFGIVIAHDKTASQDGHLIIQGTFVLPVEPDNKIANGPHKSLVLTVTTNRRYTVETPFKNVIGFVDDIEQIQQRKTGYFQLNVSSYIDTTSPNIYYIVCSIGTYLSNIIQIDVE